MRLELKDHLLVKCPKCQEDFEDSMNLDITGSIKDMVLYIDQIVCYHCGFSIYKKGITGTNTD